MSDWNDTVISQFREGRERIADRFDRGSLILLGTTGAKSGEPRVSPVAMFPHGDALVIVASYAGRPENPAWYHNLKADPEVTVERWNGDEHEAYDAVASVVEGVEREQLWPVVVEHMPFMGEYQTQTDRELPVILLERRPV